MRGSTPAFLLTAGILFVLGMEAMEPLSQEVDQPDRTESLPIDRGSLMFRHLAAPAVALVPFALVGAAAATATMNVGHHEHVTVAGAAAVAAILCLPTVLGGATGSVVSIVRDAPDPAANASSQAFLPPEMAGLTTMLRVLIPFVITVIGTLNILIVRSAWRVGDSAVAAAGRAALGTVLFIALVAWWVRKHEDFTRAIKGFMNEGREYTAQQRSAR